MQRLCGILAVVVLVIVAAAGYFYLNPQHLPSFVTHAPGFQVPATRSPMSNFQSPKF
jgi:hypothetical protein